MPGCQHGFLTNGFIVLTTLLVHSFIMCHLNTLMRDECFISKIRSFLCSKAIFILVSLRSKRIFGTQLTSN